MQSVDVGLLNRLDHLIEKHELHSRPGEPVDLGPVLEEYHDGYRDLPAGIEAIMVKWRRFGQGFVRVTYHHELKEPAASARRRHAGAHEYGHIVASHPGDVFSLWRRRSEFERHIEGCYERECERVAAYLLVPLAALREMAGHEPAYIARVLDVPEHLVELRYEIWQRYGR